MRYTPSGRPVTTFSVVTSRSWNTADGEHHADTEWFNVVTWETWPKYVNSTLPRANKFTSKAVSRPGTGRQRRCQTFHCRNRRHGNDDAW